MFTWLLACHTPEPADRAPIDVPTAPTADTAAPRLEVAAEPLPNGAIVTVVSPASRVELECVGRDDLSERHITTAEPTAAVELELLGLLGDADYDCVVRSGESTEAFSVHTAPSLVETRWSVTDHDPARSYGAYTLFNRNDTSTGLPHELILVDPEGRVRWSKVLPNPYSDCDASILLPERTLLYGGQTQIPTIETLRGEVLWKAPPRAFTAPYHHHVERLPTGEILALAGTVETNGERDWIGVEVLRFDDAGEVVWSWTSQRAVDEGHLPVPAPLHFDPWHANSVAVDADGVTYLNLREQSWLLAIDPDGGVMWRLGPGADFALVDAEGAALPDADWFWGAHAPEHHGDRILFYDNGYRRPVDVAASRALELVIDREAYTATPTWTFTEPGWYEPIWGDIDELPTGALLLTRGHCRTCDEAERSQLVEVERATDDVVWRLVFDGPGSGTYRAQRLGGCDLFANVRYCPAASTPR